MRAIPVQGKLEEYCAAEIYWYLLNLKRTCKVMFVSGNTRKIVFFEEGKPVWIVSSEPQDRLGQVFLEQGLINQAQLDFAIDRCPVGMKLGAVLVQLKFITPEDLIQGVKARARRTLLSTYAMKSGFFFLKDEAFCDEDIARIRLDAELLVRDGIQSMTDPAMLMKLLGSADHAYAATSLAACSRLTSSLRPNDIQVVRILSEGKMTLREVCSRSDLPVLEVWKSLYFLVLKGMLRVEAPAPEVMVKESAPCEQAAAV